MKKIILFFAFLAISNNGFAGDLARRVQEVYQHTDSFQANFIQKTYVEILDREIEEKGRLVFSKPGKLFIHYQGGRERKYISNGEKLWIYYPQDNEVQLFENMNGVVSREALAFLGGLGEMNKEFFVKELGQNQLELKPRNKKSLFSKLLLRINPVTHLVQEVTLFPKSGNKSHYLFSELETGKEVPAKTFEFHEKGAKVIQTLE